FLGTRSSETLCLSNPLQCRTCRSRKPARLRCSSVRLHLRFLQGRCQKRQRLHFGPLSVNLLRLKKAIAANLYSTTHQCRETPTFGGASRKRSVVKPIFHIIAYFLPLGSSPSAAASCILCRHAWIRCCHVIAPLRARSRIFRVEWTICNHARISHLAQEFHLEFGTHRRMFDVNVCERETRFERVPVTARGGDADEFSIAEQRLVAATIHIVRVHLQGHDAMLDALRFLFQQRVAADKKFFVEGNKLFEPRFERRDFCQEFAAPRAIAFFQTHCVQRAESVIPHAQIRARIHQ